MYNTWTKLGMCFYVLLFEEKYICCSLISQCSLTPSVNPSPAFSLLCLWSTSHASLRLGTHLQHGHTGTQTQWSLLQCALGGSGTDMWALRRIREDFLLLISFAQHFEVVGLTAPHSVQSVSLQSFLLGRFTWIICKGMSCQRPRNSPLCLRNSFVECNPVISNYIWYSICCSTYLFL